MRCTLFASASVLMLILANPANAASNSPSAAAGKTDGAEPATTESDRNISFAEYREWRLNYGERRRSELAMQLTASDLPAQQKSRIEQIKAYYDWLAALPEAERDRRFRERFDRIDANHDGQIDPVERSAWHDKQRALYRHNGADGSRGKQSAAATR